MSTELDDNGWLGMESAPKDGSPLLLYARAKHATAFIRIIGFYWHDMGWVEMGFHDPIGLVPLRWQALPNWPAIKWTRTEGEAA